MTGAVIPPIYATSTYKQDGVGGLRGGYEYSRSANPTRTALEGCLAALEEGERGFAFASGLAAEDTLLQRALRVPGDHVVIPDDAYGGTYRLFAKVEQPWGLAHTPAPVSDVDAVRAAIRPGETKVVWVETPTNPLLNIADIAALAALGHEAGALLVVDNTFASPYLQQPLDARRRRGRALDHEVLRRPLRRRRRRAGRHGRRARRARSRFHQNAIGAVAGPFDAWLTLRGLKTLGVRMDRHCDNAEKVVEFLERPPGRRAGDLPRAARAPRARGRQPSR